MLDSDKAKMLLNDYIEDTLDPATRNELEAFLQTDAECRTFFREAMDTRRRLQSLSVVTPSEQFDEVLRQRIVAYVQEGEKTSHPKRGVSVMVSGGVLLAALYMFFFTDIGMAPSPDEHVMPASTISTAVPGMKPAVQKATTPDKASIPKDSMETNIRKDAQKGIDLISDPK